MEINVIVINVKGYPKEHWCLMSDFDNIVCTDEMYSV